MVSTTVATLPDAHTLATGLCDARLVACVHIDPPATSHYNWQGTRHHTTEYTVKMTTTPAQWEPIQAWMSTHHPYDLPQLIATSATASRAYAQWVDQQVS